MNFLYQFFFQNQFMKINGYGYMNAFSSLTRDCTLEKSKFVISGENGWNFSAAGIF